MYTESIKSSTGLARILPDHAVCRILRFLPLQNVLSYGNTSIGNRSYVQSFIHAAILEELCPFFVQPC
jgi:hypothetical protein